MPQPLYAQERTPFMTEIEVIVYKMNIQKFRVNSWYLAQNQKYFLFHQHHFISKQGLITNKDVKIVLAKQKIIFIQFTAKFDTAFRQLKTLVHGHKVLLNFPPCTILHTLLHFLAHVSSIYSYNNFHLACAGADVGS
jgi:hypothetical protein